MPTIIRQATIEDKPRLFAFIQQSWKERLAYQIPHRWQWLYINNPYKINESLPGLKELEGYSRENIAAACQRHLHRSEFMPFAPVMTDTLAEKCFVGWKPDHMASEFMTTCYQSAELMKSKCPAVVHIDNSARTQVIFRKKIHAIMI